jgi:N-acetyl-gamma-glutamyl-phosphate reductase
VIRAAVVGGSGYGGAELLRLLLQHPDVTVRQVTSREAGRPVAEAHPALRGLTDLRFTPTDPAALEPDLDAVFLALPHGESSRLVEAIAARCAGTRLYDLAQDFRTAPNWGYGLPELGREPLRAARRVACPGCFATAILLATAPALTAGHQPVRVIVDAKTGSSGSGAAPQEQTHHPTRAGTVRAYKVFRHQHEAEVLHAWARLADGAGAPPLSFVPQSVPLVRGIYACCYLVGAGDPSYDAVERYRAYYADSPFVRILDAPPNVLDVRGTNNADLYVERQDDVLLVIAAIDNLVRGAAGQAVQCMNLALGLPEDRGLRLPALVP